MKPKYEDVDLDLAYGWIKRAEYKYPELSWEIYKFSSTQKDDLEPTYEVVIKPQMNETYIGEGESLETAAKMAISSLDPEIIRLAEN